MASKNVRQVRNVQIDTVAVVNQAVEVVRARELDMAAAEASLRRLGHTHPTPELISAYAYQSAVLTELERVTGANCTGQIGKWDFTSTESIHRSFNSYLNRRVAGMRSNWTR